MKLLIISDAWHPQVNGVVRTYEYLGEELVRRGHEVRVIGPADFPVNLPMVGYSEIRLALFPSKRIKQIIEAYQPDAIHLSTEGPLGQAGRRYCLQYGRKFTSAYHTHFPDYVAKRVARLFPFAYQFVHKTAKAYINKFHAPSAGMMIATQSLENELRSWGFKAPMHRITRGVKLDQFYPGDSGQIQNVRKPVALYVGRVAIEKNIEDFLEMDWDGTKVVVGDGPSLKSLQAAYPDAVFAGTQTGEALADYYRAADVFVFPSRTDTFGIVLIEALASGLPVAAYNVTGPKDIITEDYLGVLTENDIGTAAKQALSVGSAQQRANFVKGYYTWDNAGGQFEQALHKTHFGS
jgi:glycosyltransferase involved in cell wall biosynthesis